MHDASLTLVSDPAELARAGFLARYKDETRRNYDSDLRTYFSWCRTHQLPPLDAKRPHLELYARHLEEECRLAPATVARRLGTLSGFFKYADVDGLVDRNPMLYVRRPKVSDESTRLGLDRMELGAFIAAAKAGSPMDHALAVILGLLGFRVSEACSINIEDLGHERGHRTVTIIGKGGKKATVPMPPPVFRAVDAAAGVRTEGPLLLNQAGVRMSRYNAARIVRRLAKAAHIDKRISPHSLRHSAVTAALDAGAAIRDVQNFARHSDPKTTIRYDRARQNLDRHAAYVVSAFIAGAA